MLYGTMAMFGLPGGGGVGTSGVFVGTLGGCPGGGEVGDDEVPISGVMVEPLGGCVGGTAAGSTDSCVASTEPGEAISDGFVSESKAGLEVIDNRAPASSVDVEVAIAG